MGWEDKSWIQRLGPRHDLEALEGQWFKPLKYSIIGEEDIQIAQMKLKDRFSSATIRKIISKYREMDNPDMQIQDVLEKLDDKELEEILQDSSKMQPGDASGFKKLVLLHGTGDHNFENTEGKIEKINEDFVGRLMESKDVTIEMIAVIQEWNRPLISGSEEKSKTSLNGSSTAPNLPTKKKTESSPAEQTPPN